jgi:beta-lactamase regulating signal transducer with metallopeptidase domain/predicted  nucleic acid-binding Zn-ribbon protein
MELLVHTLMSNALAATCMAVIAVGLAWMCRRPALTHSLWLLVMLKLITPPFLFVSLPVASLISPMESSSARSPIDHDAGLVTEHEPLPHFDARDSEWAEIDERSSDSPTRFAEPEPDFALAAMPQPTTLPIEETPLPTELESGWSWEPLVLMVILAGAVAWWTLATARIVRFRRLLKDIRPAPDEWQLQTDELAERMGLTRRPSLSLVPGRVPPMLWAIGGRPRLLVPSELWKRMVADERTALLLHELAHLKRRDHWVRWLELVVGGLYWWHPVAWWARRCLREAEEQCCDAWVVSEMPNCRRTYANALLTAVEFVSGAPIAPAVASATSGSGHVSCLKRRLQMIVRAKTPKGLSWAGRFAVLAMAALALPLAPGWAQDKKSVSVKSDGKTDSEQKTIKDAARNQVDPNPSTTDKLIEGLNRQITKVEAEIDLKRSMLKDLHKKGNVVGLKPKDRLNADNKKGNSVPPENNAFSEDQIQKMIAEMDTIELELIVTKSDLEIKHSPDQPQQYRIEEEFKRDPDVLAWMQEFDETREQLGHLKRDLVFYPDATIVAAQNHYDKLQRKYDDLWTSKYPEILKRLSGGAEELEQKVDTLEKKKSKLADHLRAIGAEQKASNNDTFEAAFLSHQIQSLQSWEDQLKRNLEQLNFEASQLRDPKKQLSTLQEQYESQRKANHDHPLALQTKGNDKDDKDDDKQDKARDVAERFQEQLKNLVEKLGKELGPVAEEVRKSLEKAVGEIHKSLEKEGLTPEDLARALEKSHDDLRKAFEGGGPVDKELREAIEKAQKDMQEAFDRARGDIKDQAETLRDRARDELKRGRDEAESLRDRARDELKRGRDEAETATRREGNDAQPDRDELESARREIRDLEQKLRSATRRLDELQRRESRRGPQGRRARGPEPEPRPRDQATPRAEPKPAEPPQKPATPATPSRPARPNARRPLPPIRPVPGAGRRAPQTENDARLRELEEKMNRLLKELEGLKGEKSSTEGKAPSPDNAGPAKEASPVTF